MYSFTNLIKTIPLLLTSLEPDKCKEKGDLPEREKNKILFHEISNRINITCRLIFARPVSDSHIFINSYLREEISTRKKKTYMLHILIMKYDIELCA